MNNSKPNNLTIVTIVVFIVTSYFVFFCNQNPNTFVTKLPVIFLMFIVTMIITPITIYKLCKSNYEKQEMIIRIVSKILILITSSFLIVLLFITKGLVLQVASVLVIVNSCYILFLLVRKDSKARDVLIEHWIITSVFMGLIYFVK